MTILMRKRMDWADVEALPPYGRRLTPGRCQRNVGCAAEKDTKVQDKRRTRDVVS